MEELCPLVQKAALLSLPAHAPGLLLRVGGGAAQGGSCLQVSPWLA